MADLTGVDTMAYACGQWDTSGDVKESLSSHVRGELPDQAYLHLESDDDIHSSTY